jgi:hypothetical protein
LGRIVWPRCRARWAHGAYEGYTIDPVKATRTPKIKLNARARKAIASALRDEERTVAVVKLQAITARTGARGKTITVRVPLRA